MCLPLFAFDAVNEFSPRKIYFLPKRAARQAGEKVEGVDSFKKFKWNPLSIFTPRNFNCPNFCAPILFSVGLIMDSIRVDLSSHVLSLKESS